MNHAAQFRTDSTEVALMKRVYCLYRVSTKKQVDKNENDIPMQKTACHDFCRRQQDWKIIREFSEKGVSGYKVSASDRDAIQDLKEARPLRASSMFSGVHV